MPAKRKDKKGRVSRTGENQRKDLAYQYHYQDVTGKRRTVYAPTLEELRAKEDEINKAQDSGVDYNAGNVTVLELMERCIRLKLGVRNATKVGYNFVLNLVKKEDFGYRKIRDIKSLQYLMGRSDAGITKNVYTHATYGHTQDITATFA